jgi:predicted DNA binding CopG/RHH family protein
LTHIERYGVSAVEVEQAFKPSCSAMRRKFAAAKCVLAFLRRLKPLVGSRSHSPCVEQGYGLSRRDASRKEGDYMPNTKKARKLPKHWSEAKSEEEEARGWDANSERLMFQAAQRGALTMSTLKQLLAEMQTKEETRLLSLRLPVSDIELAKAQAEKRGLGYPTYLKSLVHQALRAARRS